MTVATTLIPIDLEPDCDYPSCAEMAHRTVQQLGTLHYSRGISMMPCYGSRKTWEAIHRTARKGAWRAERRGYRFAEVDNSRYEDDIFEINTSKPKRQGRPMADGYTVRRRHGRLSEEQTRCPRHRTHTYGILHGERLRAYMTLHRIGELAMVSMILGHGDHERNGIMYLLIAGMVEDQAGLGGWFYYNRHDSGTDGLRFKKERYGFMEADLEWIS